MSEIEELRQEVRQLSSEVATLQDVVTSLSERLDALEADPAGDTQRASFVEGFNEGRA